MRNNSAASPIHLRAMDSRKMKPVYMIVLNVPCLHRVTSDSDGVVVDAKTLQSINSFNSSGIYEWCFDWLEIGSSILENQHKNLRHHSVPFSSSRAGWTVCRCHIKQRLFIIPVFDISTKIKHIIRGWLRATPLANNKRCSAGSLALEINVWTRGRGCFCYIGRSQSFRFCGCDWRPCFL